MSDEFPAQYLKTELEETAETIEIRKEVVNQFTKVYEGGVESARNNVGFSCGAVFCKLEITKADLEAKVPPALRKGLFEKAGTYNGVIRINSTTHSGARFSIRLNVPKDVGGPMLKEAAPSAYEGKFKQIDLLMAEGLVEFISPDEKSMAHGLMLRNGPSLGEVWGILRNIRGFLSFMKGAKKATAALDWKIGIAGKSYYGGLPFGAGAKGAIKWCLLPQQKHDLTEDDAEVVDDPNTGAQAHLKNFKRWLEEHQEEGAKWDFSIQIANNGEDGKDSDEFNIELGNAHWDETKSPFVKVGTLTIPGDQELSIDTTVSKNFDPEDTDSQGKPEFHSTLFNPWNQLEAHKPLGPFQKCRYEVYRAVSKIRRGYGNGEEEPKLCPFLEMMGKK